MRGERILLVVTSWMFLGNIQISAQPPQQGPGALSKEECGLPYRDPLRRDGRILGGNESNFGEFPWQVSVMRNISGSFIHTCGGVLVDEQWVITAARCVTSKLKSQLLLRFGEHNFAVEQEPHPYIERSIKKLIIHPEYDVNSNDKDIALIQLDRPLDLPKIPHVSPVCLKYSHHQLMAQNGTITGWGRVKEGGSKGASDIMLKATLPILTNEECMVMYQAADQKIDIPEWNLCAGYAEGGVDACQGDSGTPIVVQDASGRSYLAGIASWGIGCGRPNLPGVYTRISYFIYWIRKNIS